MYNINMYCLEEKDLLIIEKKSKFFTYTFKIKTKQDFEEKFLQIKRRHPNARHFVYAYVLQQDNIFFNDGGEPKNTAGKPIANIISKNSIVFSAVICVRYFGGIKLGANGLIRTYPKGLKSIIEDNYLIQYKIINNISVTTTLSKYNKNLNYIKSFKHQVSFTNNLVVIVFNLTREEENLFDSTIIK